MDFFQGAGEFAAQFVEGRGQGLAPRREDIIAAELEKRFVRQPDRLAQAAPDAVADDRVADFLGDGETDAGRFDGIRGGVAFTRLQHEAVLMLAPPLGGGDEIGALFQSQNTKTHAGDGVRG